MPEAGQLNRPCPVCQGGEAAEFLQKREVRLVCCTRCAMVYAQPIPAKIASGRYYDEEASYYLSPAKLRSDYSEVRFERELAMFRTHCTWGRVLDVGCSTGAFLHQLTSRFPSCYEVVGADASGPALDYAESRGIKVVRGDFLEHAFKECTFDAVTFWAVLEHLAEPVRFLEQAWSLLKPGGICIVLVPNLGSLAMRLLGAHYRYVYPQHLNYFSRATLTRLVSRRFSILESRSMHFNPLVIWQDWRSGGADVSNEARARLLARTTGYKQKRLLTPLRRVYKLFEMALGKFGLADNLAMALRKQPSSSDGPVSGHSE